MEQEFISKLIDSIPDKDLLTDASIFVIKNPMTNEIYVLKNRFDETISNIDKYIHYNELTKYFTPRDTLFSQKIAYDPNLLFRNGKDLLGIV